MNKKRWLILTGVSIVLIILLGLYIYNFSEYSQIKNLSFYTKIKIPQEIINDGSTNDLSERTSSRKTGEWYYNDKKYFASSKGGVYFLSNSVTGEEQIVRVSGIIETIDYENKTIKLQLNQNPDCKDDLENKILHQVGTVCGYQLFRAHENTQMVIVKSYGKENVNILLVAKIKDFEKGDSIDLDLPLEQLIHEEIPTVIRIKGIK